MSDTPRVDALADLIRRVGPTLRCGRIDAHPPHDWSRPPGWSRPRRTYHCEGTPAAVEGGHREEADAS